MTIAQYRKKAEIARREGEAVLENGAVLWCWHSQPWREQWSLRDKNHQTVDTSYKPESFEYICSDYDWASDGRIVDWRGGAK